MKKNKIICFDIDNIICKTINKYYKKSKPIKKVISLINNLYTKGFTIKIFTARHMGKFKGNVQKVNKYGYNKTYNQLKKWGLKFDELIMGKPSYDIFIDDKAFGSEKNWINLLKKKIN